MELQKIIGNNVKTLRERRKLTLDAAAKQTGVSRSMLAQIEKGDVNPTISVLWKIANGFKVSFTSLMDSSGKESLIIRSEDIVPLIEDEGKYVNCPVFSFQENRPFEIYRIEIEEGGFLQAQPHMAGTEEYITVFSGNIEVSAAQETFRLKKGDALRFRADVEHSYKNTGHGTVNISMLIYYDKE